MAMGNRAPCVAVLLAGLVVGGAACRERPAAPPPNVDLRAEGPSPEENSVAEETSIPEGTSVPESSPAPKERPQPVAVSRLVAAAPTGSLLGPNIDWCGNRTGDSQGIRQIRYEPDRGMILECRLVAQDATSKHGECFLDLKYVPSLESLVPLDLTGQKITVEVEIPGGLDAPNDNPNGVQVFVRDKDFRAQYGAWQNWTEAGTVTASVKPSRDVATAGHTDTGFDPTACRVIGVKIGMGARFDGRWEAPIVVTRLDVDPPLPSSPPAPLPPESPLPHITAESRVVPKPDGFYVDGRKTFLVGGNWRVIEYGQNFGATAWFPEGNGVSKHPGYVAARLQSFRRAGIHLVRVGLLDDGRAVLDNEGAVTGFSQTFRNDVATFLDLAAEHNVKVEFVLIDFHAAGRGEGVGGVWLRGRGMVLEDPQIRARFMGQFLEPFLETFGGHKALFGIDVINEPEWIVSEAHGGGWEAVQDATRASKAISGDQLREFIHQCADCVHRLASDKLVTVGVSCRHLGLVAELDALDYLAPHYYPWMNSLEQNLAAIPKGKPYLLEEFPGKGDVSAYLAKVQAAGGAGALLWNLSPEIDDQSPSFASFGEMLLETREFVDGLE